MKRTTMTTTSRRLIAAVLCTALLAACTESDRPTASGKGTIRGVHAIADAPDVMFLIEERSLGTLAFRATTPAQPFDDLTYNFNFDVRLPGSGSVERLVTETLTVVPQTDYVFALTGSLDAPSLVLWETPERSWQGNETVLEVSAGHLAAGSGPLDVYFAPPGTAPAAGQPRGTLNFGDKLEPFEVENGDWVLTLTPAGDPSDVLFRSGAQDLSARSSLLYTIQDADPSLTSRIAVQRVSREGTVSNLPDPRFRPTRRFFHAAQGTATADVAIDGDLANPIVTGLEYGTVSTDVTVPSGTSEFAFTQAGNPGAVLHEEEDTVPGNSRSTAFLVGEPGDLEMISFADNRRPLADFARLRMTLLSAGIERANLWLLDAGTDRADASPNFPRLNTLSTTGYVTLVPGDYELWVTFGDDDTLAAGPVAVDLAAGDVVELAIVDTADPNRLEVVIYDP